MPFYSKKNDWSNFNAYSRKDAQGHFGLFAEGYAKAAHTLAAMTLDDRRFSDHEAWPIVFLYRHAFELYLKHFIYLCVVLLALQFDETEEEVIYGSHNLQMLARNATRLLLIHFPDAEMDALRKRISDTAKEFSEIDETSYAYRYPVNNKGIPPPRNHPMTNLRSIAEHMDGLLKDFGVIHFGLDIETYRAEEAYSLREEMRRELKSYFDDAKS